MLNIQGELNENCETLTRCGEENMLYGVESSGPVSIQSHQDKHQSLGMKWGPTEEKCKHNNN